MIRFLDRQEAGRKLAQDLLCYADQQPTVFALPRGGVPIGYEIAKALKAPLDLILVRKIGVPFQPELAAGAVVDGDEPTIVLNPTVVEPLRLSDAFLKEETDRKLVEIEERRHAYLSGRSRVDPRGTTAIVADDGIATGATIKAALRAIRRQEPARLVLAAPVAPPETVEALRQEVDAVHCLETPEFFMAIGIFYENFHQLRRKSFKETSKPPVQADPYYHMRSNDSGSGWTSSFIR
jgi:putative phosphoribosyl transferase